MYAIYSEVIDLMLMGLTIALLWCSQPPISHGCTDRFWFGNNISKSAKKGHTCAPGHSRAAVALLKPSSECHGGGWPETVPLCNSPLINGGALWRLRIRTCFWQFT